MRGGADVTINLALRGRCLFFQESQDLADVCSVADKPSEMTAVRGANQHDGGLAGFTTPGQA